MKISKAHRGRRHPYMQGKKNINWKGGITPIHIAIRNCPQMDAWRAAIFTRDHFTCVLCKNKTSRVNADHIKPFSLIIKENKIFSMKDALKCDELWDIKNGRTLCILCHKNITKKGYKHENHFRKK